MFREMRRIKQKLNEEECKAILERNTSGVLCVLGDNEFPYGVPVNYVYRNGKLYFHSAKDGHKIDAIKNNEKGSFTIIDQDKIVPEKYTSYFRSVIAFGKVRVIDDEKEMRNFLKVLSTKYCKDDDAGIEEEINRFIKNVRIIELDIMHLTGKEAIELVNDKNI
ncbi:pyridoxamine 5'-phosphate oxidase family protein [uncultured Clostridium sp.]|uniref:pyridoxamine 5'-phosphate oxidase family protein n=1 Tax=uncultured Clostridium sp. TaxID=59620 RepID=UPI002619AA9F|nr:pyridoxamine 5'-phosphate oxidase family protein [uncultured Clostridium sp.]